jgi:hypothetical protein
VWPAGVRTMVTDPTRAIRNGDDALTVAETMLATAGVGFGGASSGQTVAAGGLWETQAAPPLACLLYAASPEGNNSGMPWVLEAVGNPGIGPDDDNPAAHAKPSWLSAYALCHYTDLAEPLLAVLGMDAQMRDSVKITASEAVTPWIRLALMARDAAMQLTAVEMVSVESFDITMLDEPDATLFVLAPNTGTVAGAAVALIDSIIRHFRRKIANHQLTRRLLLELDVVCNACPLPNLLTYVGESAGLGSSTYAAPASRPTSARPRRSTWSRPSATATAGGRSRSGTQAPCRSRPTRARPAEPLDHPSRLARVARVAAVEPRIYPALPSTTMTQEVVPLPPMLRVAKRRAPATWVSPARPLTCSAASRSWRTPVAPTGWPAPMSPPLGLMGSLPPGSITPSSIAFQLSPGSVRPKWSMAMYSEVVKQSWVSMPCSSQQPLRPARAKASTMARRVCGST